jgi:hypothetical protein
MSERRGEDLSFTIALTYNQTLTNLFYHLFNFGTVVIVLLYLFDDVEVRQ